MKTVISGLYLIWVLILMIPIGIIFYKFSIYVFETEFQTWWLSIIWLFTLPISSLLIVTVFRKKR